jgi:hypothetical protein
MKYEEIPTPELNEVGAEPGLRTFSIKVGETVIAAITLRTKAIMGAKTAPSVWVTIYNTHWKQKEKVR